VINVDDRYGARQAVDYLASAGHKQIAFIAGPVYERGSQERLAGYQESMTSPNLPLRDDLVVYCVPDSEGGYSAAWLLF